MALGFLKKFVGKIAGAVAKTRERISGVIRRFTHQMDPERLDELEETLIETDMGPRLASEIRLAVEDAYRNKRIKDAEGVRSYILQRVQSMMPARESKPAEAEKPPTVILVVGVNGTGKTTTIAKLAQFYKAQGRKVLLAAADTFRAAAIEQLDTWARRTGVDIVKHQAGHDPGAVVFDACDAALARGMDVLIVDTAGRLHNKVQLMDELQKLSRVIKKKIPGAPHEVLLVLDATTGQNAVQQARVFTQDVGVTGLVITKLDGTAKGGVALAIWNEVKVPVKYIGTGESADDLAPFDPEEYAKALFGADAS
jgi:fused signal recognition particle receptor